MFLARVTGSVVATSKVASMVGHKLLTVEPLRVDPAKRDQLIGTGRTFVCTDTVVVTWHGVCEGLRPRCISRACSTGAAAHGSIAAACGADPALRRLPMRRGVRTVRRSRRRSRTA